MTPTTLIIIYGIFSILVLIVMSFFVKRDGKVGDIRVLRMQTLWGVFGVFIFGIFLLSFTQDWPVYIRFVLIAVLGALGTLFDVLLRKR